MAYSGGNPNGQATSANSAPVVIASDNVVDTASNQVITTGSITAADAASATATGQSNQSIITGTPTANSAYAFAIPNVNGAPESFSSIVIHITGTFVGTYQFERSPDGGTTWTPFSPFVAGQPATTATATLPGMFHGNIAGVTNVRVRCTALTSGTINVRFSMSVGAGTVTVGNPLRLYDLVSGSQATIKPSSTAAISTDTAIVVTEHPNSPSLTGTSKVKLSNDIANTTGTITSATSTITTGGLSGVGSATVSITGTYAGVNVTFEGSLDGTNWVTTPAQPIGSVTPAPVIVTGVLTANSTNLWNISPLLGIMYLRVRATAWTSGTANIIISPSAQFTQPIVNVGSGTLTASAANDGTVSGALAATNANVVTAALNGASTATIQVTGTWAGTLTPQASLDGTNYISLSATSLLNINTGVVSSTIGSGTQSIYQVDIAGFNFFRIIETTFTSGTANVTIRTSTANSLVALDSPIPTGNNTIGNVNITGSQAVGLSPISTTTGLTAYSNQSLAATVVYIKSSQGRLHEYDIYNPNTSGVWVQLFNANTGVTLGSTAPTRTIYVPPTSGRDWMSPYSIGFTAGIGIACTTTNTGSTAPSSAIQVYVGYI